MDLDPRHTRLITPMPSLSSEEPAIFSRVEQALEGLPGPWDVALSQGVEVGWWILSVYRADGFECTLFLDGPLQQTAAFIRDRMADALQRHAVGLAARTGDRPGARKT
jgi:hypothetical protein